MTTEQPPSTTSGTVEDVDAARGNALALYHMAQASALTASKGESRWHSTPPSEDSLAALKMLTEMDTASALVNHMFQINRTISMVVERTAIRQQQLMGSDGNVVTVQGVLQALTMSLTDYIIALGTVAEFPDSDVVAEIVKLIESERDAGTLDDLVQSPQGLLDASGKPASR